MDTFTYKDEQDMKDWRKRILALGLPVPEEMIDVEDRLRFPAWYDMQQKFKVKKHRRITGELTDAKVHTGDDLPWYLRP